MSDMLRWNQFVWSVLNGKQQGTGNEDGTTSANNLTFKKDSENFQKERGKNEQ